MPHPAHLAQPQQFWWLAIPKVCPRGEGMVVEIGKIFWETRAARGCRVGGAVFFGHVGGWKMY